MSKFTNQIIIKFDKKISVSEFDKQLPELIKGFPDDMFLLIKIRVKKNCIETIIGKNSNKFATEKLEYDLEEIKHELEDFLPTLN